MNCLCCGKTIENENELKCRWHTRCIRRFFGTSLLPSIDISDKELEMLAEASVNKGLTVPGVQKKLSLHLSREKQARLTLVDHPTGYILKPQTEDFRNLPEAEDLAMHLAECAGITTVPHALLRMGSQGGAYAYITKRIDRNIPVKGAIQMYAMEDLCQLAGRVTDDKYHGSYEQCAKLIRSYSTRPGLDVAELFYRILFFFITGNSDMHLKNFSLIESAPGNRQYALSAAYDLLPVRLVMPEDKEQLALTLNGKKQKLRRKDFLKFASGCGIADNAAERLIRKICSMQKAFLSICSDSYLPEDLKEDMAELINSGIGVLGA